MNVAFRPAWWLPGPHLQTSWAALTRPRALVTYRREEVELPDGDVIVLDHVDRPGAARLLLFHGLEGSSFAVYVQGMAARAEQRGWAVTAVNFRSCARDPEDRERALPNRSPRLYHAGETDDLEHVVQLLAAREPGRPLLAAGVSLGGNALLKWLGERGEGAPVRAAATISVPYDLAACATNLSRGIGKLYASVFLRRLKDKAAAVVRRFPEVAARVQIEGALGSENFWQFDEALTAPLHGFANAGDYYRRSSALGFLPAIRRPVLCISAADDPFQPLPALEVARQCAPQHVTLEVAHTGGHAGFVQGHRPGATESWAEARAIGWLAQQLA